MLGVALAGFEATLNSFIHSNPSNAKQLEQLAGHVFLIDVQDLNLAITLRFSQYGVELNRYADEDVDVKIAGNVKELSKMLRGERLPKGSSVSISGDLELAQQLQQVMKSIDIDWEAHLSQFVGDTPAHLAVLTGKKLLSFGQQALKSLRGNLSEYAIHELKLAPTKRELEQFYQDVSQIRNDVARLEARLNLLKRN